MEDKASQTIKIVGVEIPRWKDCEWCGAKLACVFRTYAYEQPCYDCRQTDRYKQKEEDSQAIRDSKGMDNALRANQVAAVWEGKGRLIYTNHKGDVIKEEKARPLPVGKKNWK